MTLNSDIVERLQTPHTLDIRGIVQVHALLDLVAVERSEAAAHIQALTAERDEALCPETIEDKVEAITNASLISTWNDGMNNHRLEPTLDNAGRLLRWANGHIWRLAWNGAKDRVRATTAEARVKVLEAHVEQAFRDGLAYGSNVQNADPDTAWGHSRIRAALNPQDPS